ncbi:hypothetical protein CEXT_496841, partial [Caerostris extrusa]
GSGNMYIQYCPLLYTKKENIAFIGSETCISNIVLTLHKKENIAFIGKKLHRFHR